MSTIEVGRRKYQSRPRPEDRTTRKPLAWWDRCKFLVLLAALFGFSIWTETGDNPILPVSEAVKNTLEHRQWIWILAVVELLRQIHFLIAEHWSAYYFWWQRRFAGYNRRLDKINPWTRFRIARICKWIFWFSLLNLFVAWRNDVSFFTELQSLPSDIADFLFGNDQMPTVFILAIDLLVGVGSIALLFWFMSRGGTDVYYPDDVRTRFSDVWGQDAVLAKIEENLVYLEDPESIESRGGHVPGGILLYGPPGTGKTLMAEALAGETGRPFVFVEPSAFTAMFLGVGPMKVKGLFRKLRKLSLRYGGVIVFFDEADSLGNRGVRVSGGAMATANPHCHGTSYLSPATVATLWQHRQPAEVEPKPRTGISRIMPMPMGGGGDPSMGGLQALLAEMSGISKPRGFFNRTLRRALGMQPKPPPKYRIMVMMATNMPDSLDPAFLRPGRIDRMYHVGYPAKAGRIRTYEGYLKKVKHELTPEQVEKLAVMTPYATGASIKDIVNEALIQAIEDDRDTVTWRDILQAKHLKRLGPSRDVELVALERHGVAVHEACHAFIAYRARNHLEIDLATIDPGNGYLGMVSSIQIDDRFAQYKSELEADVMVSLASLAGERLFFDGDSGSGVSGDLEQATSVTMLMEGYWGMGSTIASHAVTDPAGGGRPGIPVGEPGRAMLHQPLGERVEGQLERLMDATIALLESDREGILCLAHALEMHKTIPGEDVAAVLERRTGSMVDGSMYADRRFVQAIVEYHDEMVAAHHRGASTDFAVPTRELVTVGTGNGYGQLAEHPLSQKAHPNHPPMFIDDRGQPIVGPGIGDHPSAANGGTAEGGGQGRAEAANGGTAEGGGQGRAEAANGNGADGERVDGDGSGGDAPDGNGSAAPS
jgi:ATP-dependent Zn protease